MNKGKRERALNVHRKNSIKRVRTLIQLVLLVVLSVILVRAIVDTSSYAAPDKSKWTNAEGFVALSYFGVSRSGTEEQIAKSRLKQQLEALSNQGYRTISQQDVLDFYETGKPLPEKALFLAFEDGRNDSSLYAQPYLEEHNYKATILSYANKAGSRDPKFLQPSDMLKMTRKGFWELGSNGYRLTYINIINQRGKLLGVKDESEFRDKSQAKSYNHYLMDFVRDQNHVPVEHRNKMEARITKDYHLMNEVYMRTLGFVPKVYMIMHANSLYHGMNRLVADVNDKEIRKLFKLHYNREGNAYNRQDDQVYDLTRLQPAPYWYTNHLLMKLQQDTGQEMKFVIGDEKRSKAWKLSSGAAEFQDNRILLTSLPKGRGAIYLKGSDTYKDVTVSVKLDGILAGEQAIYVRYDEKKRTHIKVVLLNNTLVVEQKKRGQVPEQLATHKFTDIVKVNGNGPLRAKQPRELQVTLQGDKMSVRIDKSLLMDQQIIDADLVSGGIMLESFSSPLNKRDHIYDGVFDDVRVVTAQSGSNASTLYDNRLRGFDWLVSKTSKVFHGMVDWAIETF